MQDLNASKSEGDSKIASCTKLANVTKEHTASKGRQVIEREGNDLQEQWDQYERNLVEIQDKLQSVLAK